MDQSAILKFIGSLGTDKKTEKAFSSMKTSLDEIYKIKEKELKDDEKEWSKEKKEAKKKARNKKRSDADSAAKKGLLNQVFGTKEERKKAGNDMMKILGIGALVAGGGVLAFNFQDEISEWQDEISEWVTKQAKIIGTAVLDYAKDLAKDIEGWVENELAWIFTAAANNQSYSQGTTASGGGEDGTDGLKFTWQDVKYFQEKHRGKLKSNPSLEQDSEYISTASTFNQLDAQMRATKSLNDQLYDKNNKLSELKGKSNIDDATKKQIKKLKKEVEDLKKNKAASQNKVTQMWTSLGIDAQELIKYQQMSGRRSSEGAWIQRQTGGTIDNDKTKKPPSGKEIDERMFSTTDYEDGASIARRPSKEQRLHLQTGGLVLFQGHGDVPAGHAAPGTDGPGTAIQGKYKPTAEQHFVDKVAKKTALLAQKENVPIKYQRSTGKYARASHPKSNWSLANNIRRKGGSAMELHFDAWGLQNGRMIEGARGILKGGQGNLTKIEKSVQNKFGTHPSSGTKSWGTLMLELDSLKYAKSRIDAYPRMLVDAVKNSGAKGGSPSPRTQSGLPNANSFFSQYDAALTGTTPSPTPSTSPTPTPSTSPTPSPTPAFTMPDLGGMMSSVSAGMGAFMQGFTEGFTRTFKNPFAKAEQHQNGGVVGRKQSKISARMQQANSGFLQGSGNIVARPVVVVKRKAGVIPPPSGGSSAPVSSGGGGLNMVDAAAAVHRLTSGSKF